MICLNVAVTNAYHSLEEKHVNGIENTYILNLESSLRI